MPLTVHTNDDGQTVASVDGELTISTIEGLKDDLFGLLNAKDVALNLSEVTEYDGCGLQTLVMLLEEATRAQRNLRLEPAHKAIGHSMHLLGFHMLPGATTGSSHGPE
jgi:anti-anti-sigma factor